MRTISIVISAYNEEKKLSRTLTSVQWADEIVVVDSSSTDKTHSIAKEFGAKIYIQPNNQMLNINKNYGFLKATKDWIFCLDADEVISEELKKEITTILKHDTDVIGYWIPRKNIIFNKWIQHGIWWPDKQLRLFRRGYGKYPCKHVHEYIHVEGNIGNIQSPFVHYNYESISQYLTKLNTIYTENEVNNLLNSGYQISWHDAIRFPLSDFVKVYFAQQGYKDGFHGLILSLLQAFYSFIVFAKVWEKKHFTSADISQEQFSREIRRSVYEMKYWEYTASLNAPQSILSVIYKRIMRKIWGMIR
jgi:glycosyltransferase involved in cell wall biosynthesis